MLMKDIFIVLVVGILIGLIANLIIKYYFKPIERKTVNFIITVLVLICIIIILVFDNKGKENQNDRTNGDIMNNYGSTVINYNFIKNLPDDYTQNKINQREIKVGDRIDQIERIKKNYISEIEKCAPQNKSEYFNYIQLAETQYNEELYSEALENYKIAYNKCPNKPVGLLISKLKNK